MTVKTLKKTVKSSDTGLRSGEQAVGIYTKFL